MKRPQPSEYGEYYGLYVGQVPDGDVFEILEQGVRRTVDLLAAVPPERETRAYEPGKWTIREVVGHVVDVERVFAYRALSMARADPAPLPSIDQDQWAAASNAGERSLASLLDDLAAARRSTLAMLGSFDDAAWDRRGTASGFSFTVRAFSYIIAGHEIHHRKVLEARYL